MPRRNPHDGVLVIGESLIDLVDRGDGPPIEYVGGSAANVAIALARQGAQVSFATSFARDDYGRRIRERLLLDHVRLATDPYVTARTTTALATISASGSASYVFDIDWRLDTVPTDPAPAVVHVCSYSALVAPGADAVEETVEQLVGSSTITYDINMRPSITGLGADVTDRVMRMVSRSTVVKASDEDLELLLPHVSLEDAARLLGELGPIAVVVTRGGDGATAWVGDRRVDVAAPPTVVADTIGAGDTFMASLITALLERGLVGGGSMRLADASNSTWAEVLEYATTGAALSVSRPGADPPYRSELIGAPVTSATGTPGRPPTDR